MCVLWQQATGRCSAAAFTSFSVAVTASLCRRADESRSANSCRAVFHTSHGRSGPRLKGDSLNAAWRVTWCTSTLLLSVCDCVRDRRRTRESRTVETTLETYGLSRPHERTGRTRQPFTFCLSDFKSPTPVFMQLHSTAHTFNCLWWSLTLVSCLIDFCSFPYYQTPWNTLQGQWLPFRLLSLEGRKRQTQVARHHVPNMFWVDWMIFHAANCGYCYTIFLTVELSGLLCSLYPHHDCLVLQTWTFLRFIRYFQLITSSLFIAFSFTTVNSLALAL